MECLQRDGRFIMSGLCSFFVFPFPLQTLPQSCGGVPVAVQTKGVDCLWEQCVCGALVQQTIGSRSGSLVSSTIGHSIRDDAALAQFFDEYKFVFPVYASSIGHGHPEDSGHGEKVVPKPEIVKIEQKSSKGADVLSVSSDSTKDVHPHQQSGPKTSDVHSPQCIGKAKPFDFESEFTFLVKNHNLVMIRKCSSTWKLTGNFFSSTFRILDCFLLGGDCALLSDEVELRLMENAFASLRGQTMNGNAATEVSIPIWLASSTWTVCSRHSTRFSIKTSLWTHVVSRSGLVIGWRPLATQDHSLSAQHIFFVVI